MRLPGKSFGQRLCRPPWTPAGAAHASRVRRPIRGHPGTRLFPFAAHYQAARSTSAVTRAPSRCGPSTTRGHPCPRTAHPCSGFSEVGGAPVCVNHRAPEPGSRSAPVEDGPRNAEGEGTSDSRLAGQSRNRMRLGRTEKRRSWWRVRSSRVAGRAPGAVPATPTDRPTTRTLTVTRTVAHSVKSLLGCVPTEPNSAHRAPPSYTPAGEGTTPGPSA
jgi:hypothetical protein